MMEAILVMVYTCFQTASLYDERIDIKSDIAIVYGINEMFAERMRGWQEHGYRTHFMTGVAWGNYQTYIQGHFDGKVHRDEAQAMKAGEPISHGGDVFYMVPSESYAEYLTTLVKQAIDEGAEAIHLEEPEYWVRGGWSPAFQREWEEYYGVPWEAPDSSPEAWYKAADLKYHLYARCLQRVCGFIKDYAQQLGRDIPCYVPTHSLINYAHWCIVSPESSLMHLESCDGVIAQIWTGTARTPNVYHGVQKERTFETAFLEYGQMHNMIRGTGRMMWFLADPIEDTPSHTWADYKRNYECTVVASLLFPDVCHFEVMPWPQRIFCRAYPKAEMEEQEERTPEEVEKEYIPESYATEILTVINTLNDMDQHDFSWSTGTRGIGVLVSDTMMFERGWEDRDPHLSAFYGMALPLLKRGIPVEPLQMEHLDAEGYLSPYRLLLLSYDYMKPPTEACHVALADWVKAGGVLIYFGGEDNPFNSVDAWWNKDPMAYPFPQAHLFHCLNLDDKATPGFHRCKNGLVVINAEHPDHLARDMRGATMLLNEVRKALEIRGHAYREQNYLKLQRGPYLIASVLEESCSDAPLCFKGKYVDLFSPELAISSQSIVLPGHQVLLYDLNHVQHLEAKVVASASRIKDEVFEEGRLSFSSAGPKGTQAVTRIFFAQRPQQISVQTLDGEGVQFEREWHSTSNTLLLKYPNNPEGLRLEMQQDRVSPDE